MKTIVRFFQATAFTTLAPACVLMLTLPLHVNAQSVISGDRFNANHHDPDFPSLKQFNAGVMATYTNIAPPPAIIGDVTYRINQRLAVGLLGGTTGAQSLAGLKLNAVIYEKSQFKVFSRVIAVYYPGRRGQYLFDNTDKIIIPWILSMATIDAQLKTAGGVRWSVGVGVVETHCAESMKKFFFGRGEESRIMPVELFHTVQASASIPLSNKLTLRPEIILMMRKWALIPTGQFKVFPVNPFLKVVYAF